MIDDLQGNKKPKESLSPENLDTVGGSFTPINKGQFTLETQERTELFEKCRGSDDPKAYKENRHHWTDLHATHGQGSAPSVAGRQESTAA